MRISDWSSDVCSSDLIPESIVEASFGSDVLEASSAFTPREISDDGILGEGEHDDDSYPEESQSAAASDLDMASATSAQSEQGDPADAEAGNISEEQPSVPVEVDAEKLRRFAGSIVMGKADREIVLESLGCFNDVASLAPAIGQIGREP